jgi:hypothetical protein
LQTSSSAVAHYSVDSKNHKDNAHTDPEHRLAKPYYNTLERIHGKRP